MHEQIQRKASLSAKMVRDLEQSPSFGPSDGSRKGVKFADQEGMPSGEERDTEMFGGAAK